jgi:hypothetical protein
MALTKVSTGMLSADAASVDLNIDAGTMFIDASANRVGIGNTSPATALDVTGTVTADGLRVDGTPVRFVSTAPMLNFMESGVTDSNHRLRQNAGNFVIQKLSDDEGTATDRLFIDGGTGNVGIGTSSPSYALHVYETPANGAYSATTNMTPTTRFHAAESTTGAYTAIQLSANNTNSALGWWSIGTVSTSTNYDNHLVFQTRTGASTYAERMRINSSGNVGIGTDSPDSGYKLDVAGNVVFGDGGGFDMNVDGTRWQFSLGGSEKMRLDASGNLLVGKTSDAINVAGVVNYSAGIVRASRNGNSGQFGRISTDGDIVTFYKDTVTVGSIGVKASNNMVLDGAVADHAGLEFGTHTVMPREAGADADATINLGGTSRRFKDLYLSGNATHGTTPSSSAAGAFTEAVGRTTYSRGSGTGGFSHLKFINGNGTVGTVTTSGSATAYNTSSDYRLKENVVAMSGATERLKQLKPSRFNFITDADTTVDGFLAHEVQDVVPEAISGTKDAVDADGNPEYQGIDQSKLVPLLVATIQELEARIAALES